MPEEIALAHLCHLACASDVFYARVATRLGSEFSRLPLGGDVPDRYIKTESFGRYRISGCSDGIFVLTDVAGTEYRCNMKSRRVVLEACLPDDVAAYIQENDMLSYAYLNVSRGKEFGHKIVRENLRFLCGFSRWEDPDIDDDFLELAKASGIYTEDNV